MARYSKGHREAIRQKILDEAERIVSTEGPDAIIIDPLMRNLGLTHGGFYAHFSSREALLDETVNQMCDRSIAMLLKKLEGKAPIDGLIGYFENYLSQRHLTASMELCPVASLCGHVQQLGPISRQRFAGAYLDLVDKIASVLRTAKIKDSTHQARVLLSQASGAFMIARALSDSESPKPLLDSVRREVTARLRAL